MTISKTIVSSIAAVALLAGVPTGGAQAGPIAGPAMAATVDAGSNGLVTVGSGHRRRHHHHDGSNVGAAVAVGAAALIVGAAIAANQPRECWTERTKTWSKRRGAWIVTEQRVCD